MPTAADLIRVAQAEVGYTEKPRGSNRTKYGAAYGMNGVAWCAIYVWWVYDQCGINLKRVVTPGFASCEMGLAAMRSKHWTIPQAAALPGDLVFFQFDSDKAADHIGIVKSAAGGKLITLEGNTSASGSQSNGGAVLQKVRQWSQVKGVGRVPGIGNAQPPPAKVDRPAPPARPAHPNPEASPVPPPRQREDDDMPGYLVSDGSQIWLTDGLTRRQVSFNKDRWNELVFMGQANNRVDSSGNIDIPTNAVYLAEIPAVGLDTALIRRKLGV